MILSQNGVTREQLIKLLQLSISPAAQANLPIKPPTIVVNDHIFQSGPAIKFLKLEESVQKDVDPSGKETFGYRFNIKLCIEDRHWEKTKLTSGGYVQTTTKPISGIKEEVLAILQS